MPLQRLLKITRNPLCFHHLTTFLGQNLSNSRGLETGDILSQDILFRELVVQRSRAYVRQSQITAGAKAALFPKREAPKVADYSVKKTYGKLLTMVEKAFNKKQPLFTLPMYYPLAYSKVDLVTLVDSACL